MKFLLTGHTGFKGTWLSILLRELGHEVVGLGLRAEAGWLSEQVHLSDLVQNEFVGDIRNSEFVNRVMMESEFDVVIHFAAQSLVRESYRNPKYTFETNVNGTLNILESHSNSDRSAPLLIITTDKVYQNDGRKRGYVESDPLGGRDPYSASKAMADILTQSWQSSNPSTPIAIARAGNVIGGGDSSKERLMPDLISSFSRGEVPMLRFPEAVRPWQHVLDCLSGYLSLLSKLTEAHQSLGAWNIGPNLENVKTVRQVTELVGRKMGAVINWAQAEVDGLPESEFLLLDSTKARSELGWRDLLDFEESIEWTVRWHHDVNAGKAPLDATIRDIRAYLELKS